MSSTLTLTDLRRALESRDPELPQLLTTLCQQHEPPPDTPPREGALTFDKFRRHMYSREFKKLSLEERAQYRRDTIARLEADDAEVAPPQRLKAHAIIDALWEDNGPWARRCLIQIIQTVPLCYGPWKALKRIYKESEAQGDLEIWGALVARLDQEFATKYAYGREVSRRTLGYMIRRAWRHLRRLAVSLPVAYPDAAVAVLAAYGDETNWSNTWVANHIFYHATGKYSRRTWKMWRRPSTLLKHRAYPELWRRSPRPLLSLLDGARSEQARRYAATALKSDFRATLREVEPDWVARLAGRGSDIVDDFVVWILGNVPRFEQEKFRELGLHEAVLSLLDSGASGARKYAAAYARTHARDLSVAELIRLANASDDTVRKMATDLLSDRNPRKDVGLDAWGELLETRHGHDLAARVLKKHFGARELTPAWFKARLLSDNDLVFAFAEDRLLSVHPIKKLGVDFFVELLDEPELGPDTAAFAMRNLESFDVATLDPEFLKRLAVHPECSGALCQWVDDGRLKIEALGADFAKILAFHPDWETSDWVTSLRRSGRAWARELEFDESLSLRALEWLADIRRFSPEDLGFAWLMQLVKRAEPHYHDFATDRMIKAFLPADFAEGGQDPEPEPEPSGEINVDLGGASFLFTGKLKTMTRREAQGKVTAANGSKASGVSAKLDYLVIGDEGSPLYGEGRKGSKQVKAEKLIDGGAELRIISETAFLQMLAGEQREFSEDTIEEGCQALWDMALADGPPDDPLRSFALQYMRHHHVDIAPELTDRHVDPGAEIPPSFLTFERVKPLFAERRKPLRDFALELARWEFARWQPPIVGLVELAEIEYPEVRDFVSLALLAEDEREHRRYRIDPGVLTADAVYRFCESRDEGTRQLGMKLIEREPRLQIPEELFRLSESPNRQVRAFVIRTIWALYRDRGVTDGWKPTAPPEPEVARKKRKTEREKAGEDRGPGVPERPDNLPASAESLRDFMRRILFEIPPARLDRTKKPQDRLKPLPARKAKLALLEVIRDLAVADEDFATVVRPLVAEFLSSRGQSERDACLVALTRIDAAHPRLAA